MSLYPAQIDNTTSLPTAVDNLTPVTGDVVNRLRTAIIQTQTELGVKPSGTNGTVKHRLDLLEAIISSGSGISFSGDLSGSPTAQTVTGLQGRPVSSATPSDGFVLTWVAMNNDWEPVASGGGGSFTPGGDLSGNGTTQNVIGFNTVPLSAGTPTTGQTYIFDGTNFTLSTDFGAENITTTGSSTAGNFIFSGGPNLAYGTGVPGSAPTNGSLFLRTDGSSSTGLYTYQSGTWFPIGGGTTTVGGDLTGTTDAATVTGIYNTPVSNTAPTHFDVLTFDGTNWAPAATAGGPPTGTAGGDLSGFYPNPTVARVNGLPIDPSPDPNTVLVATNDPSGVWRQIVDANVDAAAAIDGSKIVPNFGAQAVLTSAFVTGRALSIHNGITTYIDSGIGDPNTLGLPWSPGSLFLRTDGYTGATLYTLQSGVWSLPAIAGSAGGDLSGTYPNPSVVAINGVTISSTPTSGYLLTATSSTTAAWSPPSTTVTPVSLAAGRLTLTSGVPFTTSDVTGASTLYYTPFKGNQISLFTGLGWTLYTFSQTSLVLTGLTSDTNYDVFISRVFPGIITLALSSAWASDTTRTDALTLQDGIMVLASDTSKRFLGTIRTTSTTTTEDSAAKRFVWNANNSKTRSLAVLESTNSWNYFTNAFRAVNGNAANCFEYVQGDSMMLAVTAVGLSSASGGTQTVSIGIGIDSTSVSSAMQMGGNALSSQAQQLQGGYKGYPALGYHKITWLEYGGTNVTFYGNAGVGTFVQTGMIGEILA